MRFIVTTFLAWFLSASALAKELALESWVRTHPAYKNTATLLQLLAEHQLKARVLSPSRQLPELFHARVTDVHGNIVFEFDLAINDTTMGDCKPGIDEPSNVRAMMVHETAEILAELVARTVPNVRHEAFNYSTKTLSAIIGLFLRHGKLLNLGLARRPQDAIAIEGALPVASTAPWAYARNRVLEQLYEVAAGLEPLVGDHEKLPDFQATEVLLKPKQILVVSAPHWRFSAAGKNVPIHPYSHTLTYGYSFQRHVEGNVLSLASGEDQLNLPGLRAGNVMAVTQFEAAWYVAKALFPDLTAAEITHSEYPDGDLLPVKVVEPIPGINCGAILTGGPLIVF